MATKIDASGWALLHMVQDDRGLIVQVTNGTHILTLSEITGGRQLGGMEVDVLRDDSAHFGIGEALAAVSGFFCDLELVALSVGNAASHEVIVLPDAEMVRLNRQRMH